MVAIRRKPAKLFHVIRINTKTGAYRLGSWFTGKLYPMRSDVSFHGKWLVYLALGAKGESWNGVSILPRLTCAAEGSNMGTWYGGGYWRSKHVLRLNKWIINKGCVPFRTENFEARFGGEDLSVLYQRLERDGWVRCGDNWGRERQVKRASKLTVLCEGGDGWDLRPSRRHPTLHLWYAGYLQHGYTFRFRLREMPDFLDDQVSWVTYDALGQLVVARKGLVTIYARIGRAAFTSRFELDFESLAPKGRG